MITGKQGGVFQRNMPPLDWDCGPIPEECYNKELTKNQIENRLLSVYLEEDRIKKLADSDDPWEILRAKISLEIIAHIDAECIWVHNLTREG